MMLTRRSYLTDATGKFRSGPLLQGTARVKHPPTVRTGEDLPRSVTLKAVPVVVPSLGQQKGKWKMY